MTTKDYQDRITQLCHRSGFGGRYYVEIYFRGKFYSCHSNNSLAWDRINSDDTTPARRLDGFYTLKSALKAFYEECKQKNNLK